MGACSRCLSVVNTSIPLSCQGKIEFPIATGKSSTPKRGDVYSGWKRGHPKRHNRKIPTPQHQSVSRMPGDESHKR
jgi:hypothetical protein